MSQIGDLNIDRLRKAAGDATALLRALAHDDRLMLLCQLSQGEMCVSDLEVELGIFQPSLSQQLGVLRRQGLVTTRRAGKNVYYRVADERAMVILKTLYQLFCGTE